MYYGYRLLALALAGSQWTLHMHGRHYESLTSY